MVSGYYLQHRPGRRLRFFVEMSSKAPSGCCVLIHHVRASPEVTSRSMAQISKSETGGRVGLLIIRKAKQSKAKQSKAKQSKAKPLPKTPIHYHSDRYQEGNKAGGS